MANYVTAQEIKDESSNYDLDLTDYTDSQIEEIVDEKEAIIEAICGQKFYTWDETFYLDGLGDPILHVPMKKPIQSISKVEIKTDYDPETWEEVESYYYDVLPYEDGNYVMRYEFTRGYRNVKITGTFGAYSSTPLSIKRAIIILVMERFDTLINGEDDIEIAKKRGVMSMSQGKWSVSFGYAGKKSESLTGNTKVDNLIQPYINPGFDIGIP